MAFCQVGYGYCQTAPTLDQTEKIPDCGSRLFNQVDRGKAPCQDHGCQHVEFYVKNCM